MREDRQLVRKLNLKLASELGRNPHGGNNYRWTRTDEDIAMGFEKRGLVEKRSPAGVIYFSSEYRTFHWAVIHGLTWCIAKWRAWDRGEWLSLHGLDFPWPQHGEYEIIGNVLHKGDLPTEQKTTEFVHFLRKHLEMTYQDHLDEANVKADIMRRRADSAVEDELDDLMMPFMHTPGTRGGNVSLPSADYRKNCEAIT